MTPVLQKTVNRAVTAKPAPSILSASRAACACEHPQSLMKASKPGVKEEKRENKQKDEKGKTIQPKFESPHVARFGDALGLMQQRNQPAVERGTPAEAQKAPAALPGSPSTQLVAAKTPSEATSPTQPAARPEGVTAPPSSGAFQGAGAEKEGNDPAGATSMGQIAAAADSPVKAHVMAQARLINSGCESSEAQIVRLAAARRQQISAQFSGVRRGLSSFFTNSIAGVQTFIATKQADIAAASASVLRWVQTTISGTLAAAEAQSNQFRDRINGMIDSATASVQGRVEGIANQITDVINSVPLPDLPGVGRLRSIAVNLLNRAAGAVNGALRTVLGIIRSVFNAGMSLLGSFLRILRQFVDAALSLASSAIMSVMRLVFQALNRIVSFIVSILQRVLFGAIMPLLSRLETLIVQSITNAEKQALAQIRDNRKRHLEALASALAPGGKRDTAKATSMGSWTAAIQRITQNAIQNNRMIIQAFEEQTGGLITLIVQALMAAAARIVAEIAARIAQAFQMVLSKVIQLIQSFTRLMQDVGTFIRELIQAFIGSLTKVVDYVRSLIQNPIDQLIEFAQGALNRMFNFVRRLVRSLISGGESPEETVGAFRPPLSFVGPAPAFAGGPIIIIGEIVIIIIGGTVIVISLTVFIIIIIVVVLLLLLLLYLLLKWLFKPKPIPPPPPPPPPPCTITTRTLASAPDGTADTRITVGVNERVEMTVTGAPATWVASSGTITPIVGNTVVWTAPDTSGPSLITATQPTGSSCSVAMIVLSPASALLTRKTDVGYTAGLAGSGFVADLTVMPISVSFSRIEVMEGSVAAVATGYYDVVLGWNGAIHPPTAGGFKPVNSRNGGLRDTVGSRAPGTPTPFSKGDFLWKIPQIFRVTGNSGTGTTYSTGDHLQDMVGTSGEETTSKEGASRNRTP